MRQKKPPGSHYQQLHVMIPPQLAALVRERASNTYRSIGQVVIDALLLAYGGDNADAISADRTGL